MPENVKSVRDSGIEEVEADIESMHEEAEDAHFRLPEPIDVVVDDVVGLDVVVEDVQYISASAIDTVFDEESDEAQRIKMQAMQTGEDPEMNEDGDFVVSEAVLFIANGDGEQGPALITSEEPDIDGVVEDFESEYLDE